MEKSNCYKELDLGAPFDCSDLRRGLTTCSHVPGFFILIFHITQVIGSNLTYNYNIKFFLSVFFYPFLEKMGKTNKGFTGRIAYIGVSKTFVGMDTIQVNGKL